MWSFALLGALLLLFPGFCALAGVIYGSRTPRLFLAAIPELPTQSATSIALIIGGALLAHIAGAALFFVQELACDGGWACWELSFDPNLYTALLSESFVDRPTSAGNLFALFYLALLGVFAGVATSLLTISNPWFQRLLRPSFAYWLYDLIRDAEKLDQVVIAHVLSNLGGNGIFAGYVGIVESIKLDMSGEITSVSLSAVDRFSVIIDEKGVRRIDSATTPMDFFHITKDDISNLNFEVIGLDLGTDRAVTGSGAGRFWPAFWSAFTLGWASPS